MRISPAQARSLGIDVPAAKGRKAKPKGLPRPEPTILPPGTVLVRIDLRMRAVPWKVPDVGRKGAVKSSRLAEFQSTLKTVAWMSRVLREPYAGPVEISVVARFAKGPLPDSTNVLKGAEDSLNGIIYVDDRQVIKNHCERTLAGFDKITIIVTTAEPTIDDEAGERTDR